jgi:dihydroorotase-like cyclic amidohydrolase
MVRRVHLTTRESRVIRSSDMFTHINTGLPLTAEVNAHHLTWADEDVPDGATLFKCMPPLRDRGNQEALWQGLQVGVLDSSAHRP